MRLLCVITLIALPFAYAMPVFSVDGSSKYSRQILIQKEPFRDGVDSSDLCNDGTIRAYDPKHCIPFTNFP